MTTATVEQGQQQNLPGVQAGSALADAIENWFRINDKENDVQEKKLESAGEIRKLLKNSKRDRVVAEHPDTQKKKEFFIDLSEERLRVRSVPDKVGQNKK